MLGAATIIVGETAWPEPVHSRDAYARLTDTAPIPVWFGSERVRLPPRRRRLDQAW